METRGGVSRLNTAAIGSFVGDGLYTRRDNTGAETMVAFAGGTMWTLNVTSFTAVASATSVFTAGVRVGTTQYENHMFIGNGGVTPYKYNGTAFTRHGVPRPSLGTASAVASASGGTFPSATYLYKYAYVNSAAAYGDVSSATTAIAVAANGSVNLTGIPVAPQSHGVNARRIYRASGTAGTYELIQTINDNTTTTFVDTYYPASTAAPSDNGEPPKYSVACQHQGRLFVNDTANPGYIWYSEVFEPYTFKATSFQPIGDQTRDLVKSLSVYDNQILVGCENGSYLLYMPTTDPADWGVIKVRTDYGSKSPFSTFLYNNKIMFGAMQNDKFVGFAAISGSNIDPEASYLDSSTNESDTKSAVIEPDMFQVQELYVGNVSAMVFKNKAYIAVTYGDGATTNNRVYIFDFSRSSFKKQEASWAPALNINAAQFTVFGGRLYYLESTATGFVNQLETTSYSDNGSAIDSYFWTKEIAGNPGHENLQKDFRKLKLLIEKSGQYYMNVGWRVDSDNGAGSVKQIDLSSDADVWGNKNWGTMVWGSGRAQEEVTLPLGQATGKRIQLMFSNQNAAGQKFKVIGVNITYNVKGRR